MTVKKTSAPPGLASRILERILIYSIRQGAVGDFIEQYFKLVEEKGRFIARLWYWMHIVQILPSFTVHSIYWSVIMFKNYLKTALRNIRRHKGYSFINIAGLAVGMACCILILIYIVYELSFDRFHENAKNIYRVATKGRVAGTTIEVATTPAPMGPALIEDFPEVLNAVRFGQQGNTMFSTGDKRFFESGLLYTDNSLLDIFSFRLIQGESAEALKAPYTMVITPEIAGKYFGGEDPVGKILRMNNVEDFTVTGVIEKPPANSHIQFDMLASFETLYQRRPEELIWFNWNYQTYILVQEGVDYREVDKKFDSFNEKFVSGMLRSMGGEIANYLQPLTSIHLHSHLEVELSPNSDIRYVYTFAAIAAFILLIACINFMNLSTARSANRAREVGMRKVVGAERSMLIKQFLGESLLLAVISLLFALVIVRLALPYFNQLAGREMSLNIVSSPWMIAGLFGIVLFVGFTAGSYPAFYLSGFMPAGVLKGDVQKGSKHSRFRSILVVFQFAVSIVLIIGTSIVYSQLDFMRNEQLGFSKEQKLVILVRDSAVAQKLELIKTEMRKIEDVEMVSGSSKIPGDDNFSMSAYFPEGFTDDQGFLMEGYAIDDDFLETYDIQLIAGRGFSREMATDQESAVLINETAAKKLEWQNAVGKRIYTLTNPQDLSQRRAMTVIGVIQDFHHRSTHHMIGPSINMFSPDNARRITLKLNTKEVTRSMAQIEEKWNTVAPGHPFDYFFMDDYYDGLYRSEERLGGIFRAFTLFAVIIGCLGLFGLASFAAEQRTKEIGIRKVLGSSSGGIVLLLCREFVLLVTIANVFAWPAAFLMMRKWLQSFPYRTDVHLATFFLAGAAAMAIALITVSYRAFKAARTNPVEALKYE